MMMFKSKAVEANKEMTKELRNMSLGDLLVSDGGKVLMFVAYSGPQERRCETCSTLSRFSEKPADIERHVLLLNTAAIIRRNDKEWKEAMQAFVCGKGYPHIDSDGAPTPEQAAGV